VKKGENERSEPGHLKSGGGGGKEVNSEKCKVKIGKYE